MNWKYTAIAAIVLTVLVGTVAIATSGDDEPDRTETDTTQPAPPASDAPEEPTFVASASSNVYAIDVATRRIEQVTANDEEQIATAPAWSSTDRIAFSEAPSGDELASLYLVEPDGTGRRRVPTRIRHLYAPTWSPDGGSIAFVRLGFGLFVVDVRTNAVRRLEATRSSDDAPAWSPDGSAIVFQRQMPTPTNLELYTVDPEGGTLRRLTRDPGQQITPSWSPDGSRLAFAEQKPDGHWAIVTMRLDGTDRRSLTEGQDPAWSPDGRRIAFVLQGRARDTIAMIDADGGKPVRLIPRNLVEAESPSWSPDGKRITFAARRTSRPPPARAPAP